jgi:hypothetical protein
MRLRFTASATLTSLLLLVACGVDDSVGNLLFDRKPRPPDPATASANRYDRASELKAKGDCAQAIPLFERFAKAGKGNEVAQLQLGDCYVETARTAPSTAAAEELRVKGAGWIFKAADSNFPSAQERAARLALDGTGVPADPAEAGKWFLLLQRNPLRTAIGPTAIDADLQQRLRQRLSAADWREATTRADRWQPVEQASTPVPATAPKPVPK